MPSWLLLGIIVLYFFVLLIVSWVTGKGSDNRSFFIGNRNSNWMLVAFGMIGTSLSGVTFVSVPGDVALSAFSYLQVVIGQALGYGVIALLLLPLYYKLNLTSIYSYLHVRFGRRAYQTGACFFILSRTLGATARLYLVVNILQDNILKNIGVPFWLTSLILLIMILAYTYKGGVKTIVWTDALQTTFMLGGLIFCAVQVLDHLHLDLAGSLRAMQDRGYTKIFNTDPYSRYFFAKQIIGGAFITITMTGMDQEMMQKTISVKKLGDAQKNMAVLSVIMLGVILLFLWLGGLLYLFAARENILASGDHIFPAIALGRLPAYISFLFTIALISALFPSADGAITALTSSFCIDLLNISERTDWNEKKKLALRQRVHVCFAMLFLVFVLFFKWVDSSSMIHVILTVAGYTYGPLLGLFAFGILCRRRVNDRAVPWIALAAPVICLMTDLFRQQLFGHFEIGLELVLINGLLMAAGLWLISGPAGPAAIVPQHERSNF